MEQSHKGIFIGKVVLSVSSQPIFKAKGSVKNNPVFLHPGFTIFLTDLHAQKSSE